MGPIAGSKLPAMELLLWLLVVFVTTTTSASQQCANSAHSVKGKYLKDHVISSGSAAHIGDCLVKCSSEPRCKSINFRFKGLFCELNDADRYMHPWDYGPGSTWHAYNDYPSKPTFKEYYMTPLWLKAHASFIDSSHYIVDDQITFNPGSSYVILKVPVLAAGDLSDETPLTVEITVSNNVSIPQSTDADIRYGLSDGDNFIGFETVDQLNYYGWNPCYGIEAIPGASLTSFNKINYRFPIGGKMSFPDQFVFTLKLDRPWGSCFIAHDRGLTKTAEYSKTLKLSQGLTLEVYKHEKDEKVGIKYIKVTIRKTNDY